MSNQDEQDRRDRREFEQQVVKLLCQLVANQESEKDILNAIDADLKQIIILLTPPVNPHIAEKIAIQFSDTNSKKENK